MDYAGMLPDDLVEKVHNMNIPTIPLSEFAKGFWGGFTGRLNPEDSRKVLAYWVQHVAGNASRAVDVIDDVTREPIARIPPVLSSGSTSNIIELFDRIREAKELSKADSPIVAKQRLEVTKREIMTEYDASPFKDSINDWMVLYTRIEGQPPVELDLTSGTDIDIGEVSEDTLRELQWE